ncbi:MAG TPA: FAD:protein FMN transferase [Burkholderiales bacterium]|nr:FAD:protein FMN transferase [Burkholderiales bacterium]
MPAPHFLGVAARCASPPPQFGLLAALALAGLLIACAPKEAPVYEEQAYVFGTLVEIKIAGEPEARARELAGVVFQEFGRLHNLLHAWKPGPLETLNDAFAKGTAAPVDDETAAVIRDATRYSEMSGGSFNPAIGNLIRLWGFQAEEFTARLPDPKEIARLTAAHPAMADIVLGNGRGSSGNPAVRLDFGGYAKGLALDIAERQLQAQGVRSALINIGGNIIAIGRRGERPWRVGIQHPRRPSALATLELADGEAIGTSGDYQRYFELNGKRYCHIIDPATGNPVEGVQAATVLVPKGPAAGTLSDVATKPMFIAGSTGWRDAARRMGVDAALLIDARGEVQVTEALAQRLEFLDRATVVRRVP